MPCQLRLMARRQQQVVVQVGVSKDQGPKPIGVSGNKGIDWDYIGITEKMELLHHNYNRGYS